MVAILIYLGCMMSPRGDLETSPRPGKLIVSGGGRAVSGWRSPLTAHLIYIKRTHRLPARHAAHGFRQQLRDRKLADLSASFRGVAERNRVGDHQLVHV